MSKKALNTIIASTVAVTAAICIIHIIEKSTGNITIGLPLLTSKKNCEMGYPCSSGPHKCVFLRAKDGKETCVMGHMEHTNLLARRHFCK